MESGLGIGDDIEAAEDSKGLGEVFRRLPAMARALRAEHVPPSGIAAIISGVCADMTARACDLAVRSMAGESWGKAPSSWCMLVLGSAGRGESLLAADQDNALIHDWTEDDHPWFGELGRRMATTLDDAGIPFCRGEVMAMNRELRHNREGWRQRLQSWFSNPNPWRC
jgi:signal-transduction protein with cAMP-binding, CBS, and nucleotidyltransferase domain